MLRVAANGAAIDARDRGNVLSRRPLRTRGVRLDAVNMCEARSQSRGAMLGGVYSPFHFRIAGIGSPFKVHGSRFRGSKVLL